MRTIASKVSAGEFKSAMPALAQILSFSAAYVLGAVLGQWLKLSPDSAATLWPPSGLYLAVFLLTEKRDWPRFMVAAMIAEISMDVWLFHFTVPAALFTFLGNTLEALTGTYIVHRWCGSLFRLQTMRDVLGLTFAAMLSPIVGATVGASATTFFGQQAFALVWPLWWIGNAVGILIVTPLILVIFQSREVWRKMSGVRWAEAAALLITLITVAHLGLSSRFQLGFTTIPALLWAALRFGLPGAPFACAVLTIMAVRYTVTGAGWFANSTINLDTRALLVQSFLGIASVATLLLAALTDQRQATLRALRRAQEELEARVAERTAALQESQFRFSALVETGSSVILGLAPDGRIFEWNRAAEQIYGWSRSEVLGQDYVQTFLPVEVREAVAKDIRNVLLGHPSEAYENEVIHRNGSLRTLLWNVCRYTDEQQRPLGLLAIGQDISQRKKAEAALRETNERLRKLSARQETLLETERARIAREIHDDLGAAMTGVKMHVGMALSAGGNSLPLVRERLTQARQLVDAANESIQRIITDLRPSALDHLGVWGGIEWLADQWQTRTGLPCETAIDPALNELSIEGERATALFRIAQESLTNVVRHAEATRVDIRAHLDGNTVCVAIQDNGKGISAESLMGIESAGLIGMQERARHFGGSLQVTREADGGTLVALRLPVRG